ncbi:MAG: tyrS2 [Herbinix sp.]|jgi:tyrosyl-tRNA synthetase|nr:tyrS2 [Herbinix sp.]
MEENLIKEREVVNMGGELKMEQEFVNMEGENIIMNQEDVNMVRIGVIVEQEQADLERETDAKLSIENQMKIIKKGTAELISEEELREKLISSKKDGRPLVIKLGLDPSAPDIHLGHAVVLRKIRQMQDLGHHAVIIIGDFTGKIGDPTGKSKTRKALSEEQVQENAKTYTDQIFKIVDPHKTTVRFNGEWLSKLSFDDVIRLAASTTVARLMERDDFSNRYKRKEPIGLHEFFYPLMQAYDSVEIHADLEIGGTDQTFNILMGRNLQSSMGKERQIALFMPILEGLDGVEKMSKSLSNYIGVFEPAEVMFKKVMEIPDHLILRYFELATDEHPDRIEEIRNQLMEGRNPRDIKLELAEIITGLYHGPFGVQAAKEYFCTVFQKGEIPDEIQELEVPSDCRTLMNLIPVLVENGFVPSGSEFRRLLKQGGVQWNGERITNLDFVLTAGVMKIGKKKFIRIQ